MLPGPLPTYSAYAFCQSKDEWLHLSGTSAQVVLHLYILHQQILNNCTDSNDRATK